MNDKVARGILGKCEEISQVLKSLSHPVRLKVLCQIMDGEKTVNELTHFCGISQSAMSQFLGRMKSEGMLRSRKEATRVYYGVADEKLLRLLRSIKEAYCK